MKVTTVIGYKEYKILCQSQYLAVKGKQFITSVQKE